jgi:hypothetical protein
VRTGVAWRLPNIKELRSIIEERCADPALNKSVFTPDIPNLSISPVEFWSASPYADDPDYAWSVELNRGYPRINEKTRKFHVLLVRD